jgi:beta-glucosidase
MDLEMPSGIFLNAATIKPLLDSGAVTLSTIDDKVRRILRLEIANGFLDRPQWTAWIPKDDPRSAATALQVAREGAVLLKNEGNLLPLDRNRIKSIVVIGPNADTFVSGGGSSHASPLHFVSLIQGLRQIAGPSVRIEQIPPPSAAFDRILGQTRYAAPLKFTFLTGDWRRRKLVTTGEESAIDHDWNGQPPGAGVSPDEYFVTWTGSIQAPASGDYLFLLRGIGGSEVRLDDRKIIGTWGNPENLTLSAHEALEAGRTYNLRVSYDHHKGDPSSVHFAWGAAPSLFSPEDAARVRAADAVVVAAGFNMTRESEGADQAGLIRLVAAANPRTAVVLDAGGSVATAGWIGQIPAVLQAWYPGQEGGRAIAEILFGDVNPSGKLPISYEKRWEDSAAFGNYPGAGGKVTYREGIFVGYRWFDFKNIAPLFPFGFGLSYTTFRYDRLGIASAPGGKWTVTFDVTNTGSRPGAEIAQVYVSPPPSFFTGRWDGAAPAASNSQVERAPRELKGFARLSLNPGETKTASVTLDRNAFAYFNEARHAWTVDAGSYGISVSASSRDSRLTGSIDLP